MEFTNFQFQSKKNSSYIKKNNEGAKIFKELLDFEKEIQYSDEEIYELAKIRKIYMTNDPFKKDEWNLVNTKKWSRERYRVTLRLDYLLKCIEKSGISNFFIVRAHFLKKFKNNHSLNLLGTTNCTKNLIKILNDSLNILIIFFWNIKY